MQCLLYNMLLSLSKISWASFPTSWPPPPTRCKLSIYHVSTYSLCSLLLAPSLPSINILDSPSFLEKKKTTKTLLETGCALYLLPLSPLSFTGDLKPATFTEFTPHVLLTVLPNTIWLFPPPLHWHSPFKSLHFVISLEVGLCKLGFKNLERRHDTAILLQFSLLFFPALAN